MAPPFAVVPATTADDSWSAGVEFATRDTLNSHWRRASPFNVVPVICDVKRGASGIAGIGLSAISAVVDAGLGQKRLRLAPDCEYLRSGWFAAGGPFT